VLKKYIEQVLAYHHHCHQREVVIVRDRCI